MRDKNILITGASGNIGCELIRGLKEIDTSHNLIAGDYQLDHARKILSEFNIIEFRKLDFADPTGFNNALTDINIVAEITGKGPSP